MVDKVAIFIDGGYVDKLIQNEFNRVRISYDAFARRLAGTSEILRTYYYHCPPYQSNPPTDEERGRTSSMNRFFTSLSRLPRFQTRLGKLAFRGTHPDGSPILVQKRVDILIGVDMVELAATNKIASAILVSGDSDLTPAIDAVKRHGVITILWHGPRRGQSSDGRDTVHQELWDACDERFQMDQMFVDSVRR